jgi:hypothetical protein
VDSLGIPTGAVVSRLLLCWFMLFTCLPQATVAQRAQLLIEPPPPSPVRAAFTRSLLAGGIARDSAQDDIPPTRWKEGALIGGLTVGFGLASFFGARCRESQSTQNCSGTFAAAFVLGAVLGGTVGALIRGQIPKEDQ